MMSQRRTPFSVLLLVLALTTLSGAAPAPAIPTSPQSMPDGLMRAVLSATAHPFAATNDGFSAHLGGLQVSFSADGLQAQLDDIAWSLSLRGYGRVEQVMAAPEPEIEQMDERLEYRRGRLVEWYRDTALGLEHGFVLSESPQGQGPLRLYIDLTTELAATLDKDGQGLSFTVPSGQILRYDHLRAWDANGAALAAHLLYTPGQIGLEVDDTRAAYPITIDPLIYREQKIIASGDREDRFGGSVAVSGDTALVGASWDDVGANVNQGSAYVFIRSGTAWILQAKLTASDGAQVDYFGDSVALSGDTALVGASMDNVGAAENQGSAYVFVRTGTTWTEQAHLTSADGATNDLFGSSVALFGDTALVGAPYDNVGSNSGQGSAYVFTRSGTTWTQQAKLTAADGAAFNYFGGSVALSADTALVGAEGARIGTNNFQGSAYVFTRSGTSWTQQAKLFAADGAADDHFGDSVALSGDTALVGASKDDVGANADQGSAYVFSRSGTTWTPQAKLIAVDGAAEDDFGYPVALAGDTALVGAFLDDISTYSNQGSAYIFTRGGTNWTQREKLTAADGAASLGFGFSVAISTDTALIGEPSYDVGVNISQGAAYVFTRNGTNWTEQAQLTGSDGEWGDNFGYSVALSADTALVGAYHDQVGTNADQGSAYVFVRSGMNWALQQKLIASEGAASDMFGYSVALYGDTALVGAQRSHVGANSDQGSAYVFVRSGTTWTEQAKLIASDGGSTDYFGTSVALFSDTALVGAPYDDIAANSNQGSAYVFTRSGNVWSERAKLTASDGAASEFFGASVALSNATALVGAYYHQVSSNFAQGAAYVFVWSGAAWMQQAQLTAADGAAGDWLGYSVALSGDTALVGAPSDNVAANSAQGSAYVFTRSSNSWTQQTRLTAADGKANDSFGASVALSGDIALVGAHYHDITSSNQGAAYVFTRSGTTWTQQAELAASDSAAGDQYGFSVALSGNTALAGAYFDDVGANTNQGSAYFYDLLYGVHLPLLRRGAP